MENYKVVYDDKFKTNYLLVRYTLKATPDNASKASLLANYLTYVNNVEKTCQEAMEKLDSLYGTNFNINVSIKGDLILFDCNLSFVANRYLQDENYLKDVNDTFLTFLFNPLVKDNNFDLDIFNLKKYELIEKIESSYDDKMVYAVERFLSIFGKDTPLSINSNGNVDILKELTNQELYDFYQDLIKTTPFVFLQLNPNDKEFKELVLKDFDVKEYQTAINKYHLDNKQEIIEDSQKIVQSKLLMGFYFPKVVTNQDYYETLVFNAIFGMSSNSLLFKIVREKEKLCYSIRANYDLYSNSIVVLAGIEKEKYQKTTDLVFEIIDKIAQGDFSEEELAEAKLVLVDMLNKTNDNQVSKIEYQANRLLAGMVADLDEDIKNIKEVSFEQVVAKAKSLQHKTTYLLGGDYHE